MGQWDVDIFTVVSNRRRGEGFAWSIKNLPREERWKYGLHGDYFEEVEAEAVVDRLNKAWGLTEIHEDEPWYACEKCDGGRVVGSWVGKEKNLKGISSLLSRISPGEIVPVGECPKCGALCHYLDSDRLTFETVTEAVAYCQSALEPIEALARIVSDNVQDDPGFTLELIQEFHGHIYSRRKMEEARENEEQRFLEGEKMEGIRDILALLYQNKISSEVAEKRLARLSESTLAEFIVDARNRGWITNFNLGLDDEGNVI